MRVSRYISQIDLGTGGILLVNALTGAVDVASRDLVSALRLDPQALPGDTLALLEKRGHLLSSATEEQMMLETLGKKAHSLRLGKRPREYIICPTYTCNLACTYCFEGTGRRRPDVMGDEHLDALFRAIDELLKDETRPPILELFGGEPLLPSTRDAVSRILDEGARRGLKTNIVTNGVNVLPFADILEAHPPDTIAFQITIDGPPAVHNQRRRFRSRDNPGTFDQMMAAVDFLARRGHGVNIRINVDEHNIAALPELAALIDGAGWLAGGNVRCSIAPVETHIADATYPYYMRQDQVVARVHDLFEEHPGMADVIGFHYYRLVDRIAGTLDLGGSEYAGPNFFYCESCMFDNVVFGVDGYIYACPEAIDQPRFAVGRFMPKLELDEERCAEWAHRSALEMPKCRDCEIISFCAGGCAYAALYANGSLYEPVCGDAKLVVAEYAKYAAGKKGLKLPRGSSAPRPSVADVGQAPPPIA